jgi:putative sigma-54 modulation protein
MNIKITARHFNLSETLKNFIESEMLELDKYNLDIVSKSVILDKGKKDFSAEIILYIKGNKTVIIENEDKDIYEAFHKAYKKIDKKLAKIADRIKEKHHDKIEFKEVEVEELMTLEDALNKLKNSNDLFIVFYDENGETRTLFKKEDNLFGMY